MDSYRPAIMFFILISFHAGQTLRCACKEDFRTCASIHNMQANFTTAQQICMKNGGKLLTPWSKIIGSLLFNKTGHFWIGTGCDCLSSKRNSQGDIATLNRGGEGVECSSQCISVSSNRELAKRSCEEQADGFLCDGIDWENCWESQPSEVQILNKKDCGLAPCEHKCEEVPGGHMCSCFKRYRPRRKNPEYCESSCNSDSCPLPCPTCRCPDGFLKDEAQCTDLDECDLNDHNCAQKCRNTIGSYKCSCDEGFMLVNRSECVRLINPTPVTATLVTQSVNYELSHAAFGTPAEYIGLILFILLVIPALIGLLYYFRKSKGDVLLKDGNASDDTMVQEAQLQL
ncbi:signal peptide, CUB and EGF-like domain-containing protein 1 [Neoarius graeffei]|uniref:signal peptide, CUB and EGF-like domain-containing protein 1 n=1 Tax=Neoarius graeffei TaxID=443677 RepID=UPI00298C62F4|nr:signal peptide, CUB and EGF-like domain-containing protein 1 [Neoarius graeffei]